MKAVEDVVDASEARKQLSGDRITVGLATCGISAGGIPVLDKLRQSKLGILVESVGCSGMCYNEPVVTVRQNGIYSIYSKVTSENVSELIKSIRQGKVNKKMLSGHSLTDIDYYKKQRRLVMENCGLIDPTSLEQYVACGGFSGLEKALQMSPQEVIATVDKSNLRGRGGAFPTGKKWAMMASHSGKKYIICNGNEGDPGAFMNRVLLESDPYKVLEGMLIAAYAIGSDEAYIYVRAEYPLAIKTCEEAINRLKRKGLLGRNILGKDGFNLDIIMKKGAGAFVCGEETSLINSVMGNRGYPTSKPPYPTDKGLWGLPTNVNNVDTLGNVTTIFKIGVDEYTKVGTDKTKGTKTICLVGKLNRTGVVEVPFGVTLREFIYDIGGGMPKGTKLKAVQSGGPSGVCIPASQIDKPLDYDILPFGSGGFIVLSDRDCMVEMSRYFLDFTRQESCGKCTPCREGNTRLLELLEKITGGTATENDLNMIMKLSTFIKDTSLCGLGQAAPSPVLSTMENFMGEYRDHVLKKRCAAGVCKFKDIK
ncbi:MAG: NADH-ubiquinone oxidoreductase-F iron-sulfur binding region domain-containing protein [Candidatus Altiarchaeota archaeon]